MSEKTSKNRELGEDELSAWRYGFERAAAIVGLSLPSLRLEEDLDEMQNFKIIDVTKFHVDRYFLFMEQIHNVIFEFTVTSYSKRIKEKEDGYSKKSSAAFMHISRLSDELANQLDNIDGDLRESLAYYVRSLDQIQSSIGELRDASDSAAWKMIKDIPHKRRGRPRQDDLRFLIYKLANLYEIWSKKKFTFLRFKDSGGEYGVITEGHQFVFHLIDKVNCILLEDDRISSTSITTECERAVTDLKTSSQPRKNPQNT